MQLVLVRSVSIVCVAVDSIRCRVKCPSCSIDESSRVLASSSAVSARAAVHEKIPQKYPRGYLIY